MPASTLTFYDCFAQDLGRKVHNLHTDTLKIALTNTAPNVATHTGLADITEIAAGNGYTAGGMTPTVGSYSQTSGLGKLVYTLDLTLTASGGAIATWRYAVLYNDTAASDPLIGYWDFGSAVSLADTESENFDLDQTNGVLQVTD